MDTTTTSSDSSDGSDSDASDGSGSSGGPQSIIEWEYPLDDVAVIHGLAAGPDLVYILHGFMRLTAIDAAGQEVFDVDIEALLGRTFFSGDVFSVVARDDGSVLVQAGSHLLALDDTGALEWTSEPSVPGLGVARLSHPAVGSGGVIYARMDFGSASNAGLPRIVAVDEGGAQLWTQVIASDSERINGVPPPAGMPTIGSDGAVWALVSTASTTSLRRVDPLIEGFDRFDLDADAPSSRTMMPVSDGFIVGAQPPDAPDSGCGDAGATRRLVEVSTSGATRWVFDYESEQFAAAPTTDGDGNLLLAWGNCTDGNGAGVYVTSPDGTLDATFSSLFGDGTFVVAGPQELFLFEQDRSGGGGAEGPVVHVLDRATLTDREQHLLPCATDVQGAEAWPFVTTRDDGTLVAACIGEGLGSGGVFGLALDATPQGSWPLPHGDNRGNRRF